jgi:hypothetical protein
MTACNCRKHVWKSEDVIHDILFEGGLTMDKFEWKNGYRVRFPLK